MKAFVLLLTLAFASHFVDVESRMTLAQVNNGLKSVRKSCIAKTGVAKELVDATRNGEFAEDRALMCFYNCAMTMMKTARDGKFNPAAFERQVDTMLPEDVVERTKAMSEICYPQITSDDGCEGSWQYAKCNWETDKDAYFFP